MNKLYIIPLLMLAACAPPADTKINVQSPNQSTELVQGRVDVTRIGIIQDPLAYNDRRGIYIIVDNKTGKEYIGVSGIGITETGSHNCGKNCTKQDER